ncbi:MAG: tRNA (N(6)-L-threonylcarbamoyladenosine(37)-C(2))-methylthiotransferase MtaB [Candidatus Kapaibacterium sp.]|jgi:threonylcarbamoyladenosine tRNA methylthiotransferase MtaB
MHTIQNSHSEHTHPSAETRKRVTLHTLGCKLNYAETMTVGRQFTAQGYTIVPFGEPSEIFVLNTCSVTENAEKECRQLVRRVLRKSPNAFVAVTGCYAQLRPEQIASIEGVDMVLGANEKFEIYRHGYPFVKLATPVILSNDIAEATTFEAASSLHSDDRTRGFLKVQDGCDYSCSFCTIPTARGASRSAEVESIVQQAQALSRDGFQEIILSGVNVGDFGRKIGSSFEELLRALDTDPLVTARLRISSIEPNLLTSEIIQMATASKKICPHFHIPLQSGSAIILSKMQRRYTRELYRERISEIKRLMPHAAIGVDVIVGFPGEGEKEFRETYEFLNELDITYLHVFTYSERPDTKAITLGNPVPVHERKERNKMLRILSEKKKRAFYESQIGTIRTVLLEAPEMTCASAAGEIAGFTENYVRVRFEGTPPLLAELVRVRLLRVVGDIVVAEFIEVLSRKQLATSRELSADVLSFSLPILQSA